MSRNDSCAYHGLSRRRRLCGACTAAVQPSRHTAEAIVFVISDTHIRGRRELHPRVTGVPGLPTDEGAFGILSPRLHDFYCAQPCSRWPHHNGCNHRCPTRMLACSARHGIPSSRLVPVCLLARSIVLYWRQAASRCTARSLLRPTQSSTECPF